MDIVGTIALTQASEIIFYVDTYKGRELANIRRFVKSEKYTGPTKSGIVLNKEQLEIIYKILAKASNLISNPSEKELGKIPISDNWFMRIGFNYFNGVYGLDIRQYFNTEKRTGPTKKGVRIPLDCFDETVGYCEKMLELINNPQKKETTSEKQEDSSSQKSAERTKKGVDGVPNDYQKYFS